MELNRLDRTTIEDDKHKSHVMRKSVVYSGVKTLIALQPGVTLQPLSW